jgi:3-hydroxybutyryl-CoA dehydratase
MAESSTPAAPPAPFLGPNEALGGVSVGDEAEWERTVTQAHVEGYAEITGDTNPLHFDKEYAESTVFKSLITHGGIQSGALNALVAMKLPGPGSVFMAQNLKYSAPVRVGDVVRASGKVTKVQFLFHVFLSSLVWASCTPSLLHLPLSRLCHCNSAQPTNPPYAGARQEANLQHGHRRHCHGGARRGAAG